MPVGAGRSPRVDSEAWLAWVVAACLLVEAVVARNVLDVELDLFSQFAAMWVYLGYLVTRTTHERSSPAATALVAIGATVAVLVLYAM